ncbi:uncharacterized protein [Oryza sativa Japonica Group]|jgi:hypothetical protein|uniref:Os02g0834300 protein n=3 Tax=Oryza TaxID=4527 RepID=Q6EP30_ORYSJ|nr:uncharacterized protein LOC4331274 [Oryza sativa Japonica Group]KAB8089719.1 hypothetical protein EE612_014704 [Oryza sativa]EAZ25221.1 hypothetical protein OsJ_09022 [Oryza sativa Japonica Group]KAF2947850.1 hypothetical protein DAI22_02g398800 [Oryza sativa Japonica Group]BAD28464.1 ferredoxin-like [Oryza sativa Japonica Group]BAD29590.1 ferredoxin-like [Oryza sativa Japonica Group]|eukprot:NP_001048640.1 Os02g0834300 [Oryza sativa Japonica Group]
MREIWSSFGLWMLLLMLEAVSPAKIHGNPANDLVALVNANRTATKLPHLRTSAGLGCMALQYISDCIGIGIGCAGDNTVACQPPEAHITEVYAANCGVELPTVDVITGRLLGCHRQRSDAEAALEAVLSGSGNSTAARAVIRGKEHTQVGAGFDRAHRRGPFFWCLLFSSGSANSTFLLEAAGKGVHQSHGCFSVPDNTSLSLSCSSAAAAAVPLLFFILLLLPVLQVYY